MARTSRDPEAAKKSAGRQHWKSAIYIRLSREDGNDESYSVTNQRQRLSTYFETLIGCESMELFDFYIDDGFSGTDSDRDSFQRMLADIDAGKVNCVIVKDLSRLSRNDWECKRYLQHLFVMKNVRFISLELPKLDSFRRPDEVYDLGVSIQSMYNENHCRETSIKVRGTFDSKREKGEFIGAFAPYGYHKDPENRHKLIVDDEAAAIVRDIFHWFVREGMSKNGIVKRLIAMGIPCPAAYKRQNGLNYHNPMVDRHEPLWSARSITQILSNQMYLGHMVQGKQKVKSYKVHSKVTTPESEWFIRENMHEPIVDAEIFTQAQMLLQRDTRTAPNSGKLYPFSGFLRCADCRKAMCRRESKNIVYYACRTYLNTGVCSRHSIRHDFLEQAVQAAIHAQVVIMDDMADLIDEINRAPAVRNSGKRLVDSLQQRRKDLEKASALRTGLYVDWKSGDITREEYHSMKGEFEEKEATFREDIARLEEEIRALESGMISANPAFEAFRKQHGIAEINRGIVTELIRTVYIHEGGEIDIDFAFGDETARAAEFIETNRVAVSV